MLKPAIKIGPADAGKPMSLSDFEHAEAQDGHLYELARRVIVVSDVPGFKHFAQVDTLRGQFYVYRAANPGRIYRIGASSDCKLLVSRLQTERHPDLALYLTPPPEQEGDIWSEWIPDIVVEIVSLGSELRDYVEKREEYLALAVKEYWIFDAEKEEVLILRRRGKQRVAQWTAKTIRPPETYRTRLLPGFELDCDAVFAAAR